jgi:hypothetical protein
MASTYNTRPLAAEVLVSGKNLPSRANDKK